jgi:hypothetical protein
MAVLLPDRRQSWSYLQESGRQMDNFYGKRVLRLCTEMDFRKIVNAFGESDRFGLSKSLCQAFTMVTGDSRADRPSASRST